jgi:hypothetical protein
MDMDKDIKLSEAGCCISDAGNYKSKVSHSYSILCFLFSVFCLYFISGCESSNNQENPFVERIELLTKQNDQLAYDLEQSTAENKQLKNQIKVLADLPEQDRLGSLYNLQKIEIGKFTGFFDKDKDGTKEKLIVYIQPLDEEGDAIKAAGAVEVQLWNLNTSETGNALLGQWQVNPEEMKKLWFATMVKTNYRLTFDITDKVTSFEEPLTVKVTFIDYHTGKIFKEQIVIEPENS